MLLRPPQLPLPLLQSLLLLQAQAQAQALVLVLVPVPVPVLVPGTHCSTRENEDCARRARQGRDPLPPALACETIMKRNKNRSLDGFLSRLAPLHHGRGNDFRSGESGEIEQRRAAGSWREEKPMALVVRGFCRGRARRTQLTRRRREV